MDNKRHGLVVRGDSLYCPLALNLDSYWNCLVNCWHCYLRHLNHTWGKQLRPTNAEALARKLRNGQKAKNPKSPLAWALKNKNTIRFGNKTDPFQPAERKHRVTKRILYVLLQADWTFVLQTLLTEVMMEYEDLLLKAKHLAIVQPTISCGLDSDWEVLERKRTTPPMKRLKHIKELHRQGMKVAVYGEPFIPGYHTVEQFEDTLKLLKANCIKRYNVYNFHFNAFVAKRLSKIGIDVEAIWYHNQDHVWKPILGSLLQLGIKYDIIIGCPDFVNSGPQYRDRANTCCGVEVPYPTTYNTHTWKRLLQDGWDPGVILDTTWDGVGDLSKGISVMWENSDEFYTMADAGMMKPKKPKGTLL